MDKIKTFHEFDFQITFGGKNLWCSYEIWWVCFLLTHKNGLRKSLEIKERHNT
jgi:hypothetical protein